jgi:hypothetical protein
MADLGTLSRRRFVRLAMLTSSSLVIGTNQVHAADEPCPKGGQKCTYCMIHFAKATGGKAALPGLFPDINPWRDWRNLRFVTPH